MKIDMHCHVKEGSLDSKVSVEEYIMLLKAKGFQGMVKPNRMLAKKAVADLWQPLF